MDFIVLVIIQYWRQLLALLAVVLIGQWIMANPWTTAAIVAGVVAMLAVVAVLVAWFAPAAKPTPVYPRPEINPDLLRRLEERRANLRTERT